MLKFSKQLFYNIHIDLMHFVLGACWSFTFIFIFFFQKLEKCYNVILSLMNNATDRENTDALHSHVSIIHESHIIILDFETLK